MLSSPKEIIVTLEKAVRLADKDLEKARFLVVACKHSLQAHALEFAKERFQFEKAVAMLPMRSAKEE